MADYYLGLDVGGTKTAAGIVTSAGQVLSHVRAETSALRSGGDPLSGLLRLGGEAVEAAGSVSLTGVGVALPGPVDRRELRMLAAPTLPELAGVSLTSAFQDAFGCPAAGDNDANGCALAEARFGAGEGRSHVVYVTVSTGIGGGIVVDGRLFRGASGTSAEFGHQVILPTGGPRCDCGNHGCLEALVSGRGIAARTRLALSQLPEGQSRSWDTPDLSPASVAEAARVGDVLALHIWRESALYLGLGLSNVINLLDPDIVVVGGGVALGAADLLFDPVRGIVARRCMPSLARPTQIAPAALGSEVGLVGAACLVMEALAGAGRRN